MDELDRILDVYEARLEEQRHGLDRERTERQAFLAAFSTWVTQTAEPLFAEIVQRLKERGFKAAVDVPQRAAGQRVSGITLTIDYPPKEAYARQISFEYHGAGSGTLVARTVRGEGSETDMLRLDDLTRDALQGFVLKRLEDALRR